MTVASRRRFWLKFAQVNPGTSTAPATTAPATTTTTPAAPAITGNPTSINVNALFSRVGVGWGPQNLAHIQVIVDALNWGIWFLSSGQFDFNKFRQQYFLTTITNVPDANLMHLVRYSAWVYNRMLTPGGGTTQFLQPLTTQEKTAIVRFLVASLNSPLSLIPDGGINAALQAKIGGNLKITIGNALSNIK